MKHLPLIAAVFLAAACVDRTVEPYSAGGLDLPDADLARQDRASTSREDKSGKGDNGPGCVHPKVVKDCKKDSQGVAWCTIPAGCFQMGSPETEKCRGSDETRHRVTLTHKFEIQSTEVTQAQFKQVMGYSQANFTSCGGTCPEEEVNWFGAAAYCNALSTRTGLARCYKCSGSGKSVSCQEEAAYRGKGIYACKGYRLPTEAEWEYAYRAGTATGLYNGKIDETGCGLCVTNDANADKISWYCFNSNNKTHPAGQKTPNAWGLYDMAGNVWEWCHDRYHNYGSSAVTDPWGSPSAFKRVLRGGSWYFKPYALRAGTRYQFTPSNRLDVIGFRCSRTRF